MLIVFVWHRILANFEVAMGALLGGGADLALQVASGTLTGLADAGTAIMLRGNFNISVWGTFVATVELERSFDGGTTWIRVTFSDGGALTYKAPASAVWSEAEYGVLFRLRCTAYTSGSINWRLSLGSDALTSTPVNISDGAPNILPNAPLNILASTYNPITNTPSIAANGTGAGAGANNGYVVAVAGTVTVDSIGTVSVGDIIFNAGGTKWIRAPYSAVYKTMSLQDADGVAITGGSATGLSRVGVSNGDEIQPTIQPDYAYLIRDADGNIAFSIDTNGTVSVGPGTADTLSVGTLSTDSYSPTQIGIGGDKYQVQEQLVPDLFHTVRDEDGNIVSGYGPDGRFSVVGLNSSGPLVINGGTIGETMPPSDAIDVTAAAYGAVGDAAENICVATVTNNNTLAISNYIGTLSLEQSTAGTATLTIEVPEQSGIGFQPYHAGQTAEIVVSSTTIVATVIRWTDSQNIILNTGTISDITSTVGTITVPAFKDSDAGARLIIDGMGKRVYYPGDFGVGSVDATLPYGQQAFITTIGTVVSGRQITTTTNMPFAWSSQPARIWWGTNNGEAIAKAGQAAFASGKRKLHFPGAGKYLAIMLHGNVGDVAYASGPATDPDAAMNGTIWQSDGADVLAFSGAGWSLPNRAAPIGADPDRAPDRMFHGRGSFRRCSQLTAINLFIVGDSQGAFNPQNQSASWMQSQKFVEEFKRANPGKTINVYQMSTGGSTWAILADPANTMNNSNAQGHGWSVPRPISGGPSLLSFFANANQTGSGAPILPDCAAIFQSEGNDKMGIDGFSMDAVINTFLNVNHGDAYGPTDIILRTDHQGVTPISNSGNGGGINVPDIGFLSHYWEYGAGLARSKALVKGYAVADLQGAVMRACFGFDPKRLAMRAIPNITATASPASPLQIPFRCRDIAFWMQLTGTDEATVWSSLGTLSIQISEQPGNKLMLRQGANGRLWCGVAAWGEAVSTSVTSLSGTALTVAAHTTYTNQTITVKLPVRQVSVTEAPFSSGDVGKCILLPTGRGAQKQRNFIRGFIDSQDVTVYEHSFKNNDLNHVAGQTISIGGAQFMSQDGLTRPDVVVFFDDGTIWNTTVASGGYTSPTQVTLSDSAPQTLTAETALVFVGRMGVPWFDTGLDLSSISSSGVFEINVSRDMLMIGYKPASYVTPYYFVDRPIQRFGGGFYPVITPETSQEIVLTNVWVDERKMFAPTTTPWEIRGIADPQQAYYLGGVGGHPASRLRTDAMDPFWSVQNLCTY